MFLNSNIYRNSARHKNAFYPCKQVQQRLSISRKINYLPFELATQKVILTSSSSVDERRWQRRRKKAKQLSKFNLREKVCKKREIDGE